MLCLVIYGFSLENRLGALKYALIYAISILGSGLLINFAGGRGGIHAGASGAIWGLMTATLIYNLRNHLNPAYAPRGIVVNLIYSFSAGVSWQGHIGGGIAGLAAALALCISSVPNQRRIEG
jgi:membrane associated rhomboid family serine protease